MSSSRYDFHIHSKYSACGGPDMEIPAVVRECKRLGITRLAITDHISSFAGKNSPASAREDIENLSPDPEVEVYFGVEVNFTGNNHGFSSSREIKERCRVQFLMASIHSSCAEEYDLQKMITVHHRLLMKICRNPLIEVLGHPYHFSELEFGRKGWPLFNSMKEVPESYVRELGQASRETGTAIEINGKHALLNPAFSRDGIKEYLDFLFILAEEGAIFSPGSDAHDLEGLARFQESWKLVERLKLNPEKIWKPPCKPLAGGKRWKASLI